LWASVEVACQRSIICAHVSGTPSMSGITAWIDLGGGPAWPSANSALMESLEVPSPVMWGGRRVLADPGEGLAGQVLQQRAAVDQHRLV
jgi:hypothetical protein